MSISKPDEGNVVLILSVVVVGYLFNVFEIVLYFWDIILMLAGSTCSAKACVTESAQFPNAVSYERSYCDFIAYNFQLCKNPLNSVYLKKN
jgi:hypothetical protein